MRRRCRGCSAPAPLLAEVEAPAAELSAQHVGSGRSHPGDPLLPAAVAGNRVRLLHWVPETAAGPGGEPAARRAPGDLSLLAAQSPARLRAQRLVRHYQALPLPDHVAADLRGVDPRLPPRLSGPAPAADAARRPDWLHAQRSGRDPGLSRPQPLSLPHPFTHAGAAAPHG